MSENRLDIISPKPGPALNTTSDLPIVETDPVVTETSGTPTETPTPETPTPVETPPEAETQRRQRITEAEARRAAEKRHDDLLARVDKLLEINESLTKELRERPAKPVEEPTTPLDADVRPRRDSYDNPDAYEDDLLAWQTRKITAEVDKKFADQKAAEEKAFNDRAAQTQQQEWQKTWAERRTAAISAHADFAEVAEASTLPVTIPMAAAMVQADNGPEIAYWLGKNPEEAARISALSANPVRVAYEIGRIGQRLAAATATEPPEPEITPTPVNLPPPIVPLGGNTGTAYERSLSEVGTEGSMEEYARLRQPSLEAERRASMFGNRRVN